MTTARKYYLHHTRYTPGEIARAVEMRRAGLTLDCILAKLGRRAPDVLTRHLRAAGFDPAPRRVATSGTKRGQTCVWCDAALSSQTGPYDAPPCCQQEVRIRTHQERVGRELAQRGSAT